MSKRSGTAVRVAALGLGVVSVGLFSASCFEDPEPITCWNVDLAQIIVDPSSPMTGTEFDITTERFYGGTGEGSSEWTLSHRLVGEGGNVLCSGEIGGLTFAGIEPFEGEQPVDVTGLELCAVSTPAELAEVLPAGTYTLEAESSFVCDPETLSRELVIQTACGAEAPEFDVLDLVIQGLATDPSVSTGPQLSFTWEYGYEFESSGSPSPLGTGPFTQRLTLRNLDTGDELSHEEPGATVGDEEDGTVTAVVPLQDVASQEQLVPGNDYALRVELDPDGDVLQCGPGVEENDAACIQFSLPGSFTPSDCSAFE